MSYWDNTAGTNWGTTSQTYKSGPVSITDSPFGNYDPDSHQAILLNAQIDLHETTTAYAQFWARWDIEDHYDYVVFQASTDGESWENLCGEQSKLGSLFQLYEEPLYDGKQLHWVRENVDLSSYIGQSIQLRFLLVSDGFVHKDGFYFDNFQVITIKEDVTATEEPTQGLCTAYPNPAGNAFTITLPQLQRPSVSVYNAQGQLVFEARHVETPSLVIQTSDWTPGLYQYRVSSDDRFVQSGKMSILH